MDLKDAREQLEQMLAGIDAMLAPSPRPEEADDEVVDREGASDAASELTENDRLQAEREAAVEHRSQVGAALKRLDEGTYGTCVDCGKPISEARLQVRPEAARCVECQAKAEAA